MMTITVTEWEVEEFVEQTALRPALWLGKNKLWVRKDEGENIFAVKFKNGLPNGMFSVNIVPMHGRCTQEYADRYVRWLLSKFTSFEERCAATDYLAEKLYSHGVDAEKICEIATELSRPRGWKPCVKDHEEAPTEVIDPVSVEIVTSAPTNPPPKEMTPSSSSSTPEPSCTSKKSLTYLQRLLLKSSQR